MFVPLAMNMLPACKEEGRRCVFANMDLWAMGGLSVLVSSESWVKLKSWVKKQDSLELKSWCPWEENIILFICFYYKKFCQL